MQIKPYIFTVIIQTEVIASPPVALTLPAKKEPLVPIVTIPGAYF